MNSAEIIDQQTKSMGVIVIRLGENFNLKKFTSKSSKIIDNHNPNSRAKGHSDLTILYNRKSRLLQNSRFQAHAINLKFRRFSEFLITSVLIN